MKHLLPQKTHYKASLHTHSTISDGKLTPEQVKAVYRERGYSILALTDHSAMIPHNDLTEPDFLMLTGAEMDMPHANGGKTCHLCMLSRDPELRWIPFRDREPLEHMLPYMDQCECEGMEQCHSVENINAVVARANRRGMLVTYNHPAWSMEYHQDYSGFEGFWAMEYRNSSCIASGYDENNGWVFRELINMGKPLLPVMADDMHSVNHGKTGYPVAGMGWTMVAADRLSYDCVMDALARGDLYCSCGPEIHSIVWDDGILRVTCSPAAKIRVIKNRRPFRMVWGVGVTEGEFPMKRWYELSKNDPDAWFYVIVENDDGTYAVSKAYTPADLI